MAFFSNGQSSGGVPDSEKRRPDAMRSHKKKLEIPPLPQKKPDSSDRSALPNQGTPSEPILKVPSASKSKRVAGGKRAEDNEAAKEQPELKKKSASKRKKPVEEEGVRASPTKRAKDNEAAKEQPELKKKSASKRKKHVEEEGVRASPTKRAKDNEAAKEQPEIKKKSASKRKKPVEEEGVRASPTKKKLLKQQQESAAVAAVATPAKGSLQKSSKKTAIVCAVNNETANKHGCPGSTRENPVVDEAGVQAEGNWRMLEIFKLELTLQRIAVMKEQCSMMIEALKANRGNARTLLSLKYSRSARVHFRILLQSNCQCLVSSFQGFVFTAITCSSFC